MVAEGRPANTRLAQEATGGRVRGQNTGVKPDFEAMLVRAAVAIDPAGVRSGEPVDPAAFKAHRRAFVMDLEMSGPNPSMHELLDLGWVEATLTSPIAEASSWGSRVRPRHIGNAVPGALKVVGYSPKNWKDAVELEHAIGHMAQSAEGAIFAGWGFEQDLAFVAELLRRVDKPWPFAPFAIDVQRVARQVLSRGEEVDRFNLGHVADRLGIGRMGEHGALPDAYATFDILVELEKRASVNEST